ncbi:uncharacterized protein LOC110613662 [Manihot esculenta]|uniref:uncharacterized protein LOC110613662 n=1 Tax=Manihot esculenta TaxID=3983 RepID=UPI000B5D27C5|nr:uncharacterized protein LOC110613662 [Manihot esculenta]
MAPSVGTKGTFSSPEFLNPPIEIHMELVLTNGIEVKLQRNALSGIEDPTDSEDDDDLEFDNVQWNGSDMSKGSVPTPRGTAKVDLSKLEMAALWRYWRHFNLVDVVPNPSKEQLVDVVQRHFMSQQMDELQVIVGFVQSLQAKT